MQGGGEPGSSSSQHATLLPSVSPDGGVAPTPQSLLTAMAPTARQGQGNKSREVQNVHSYKISTSKSPSLPGMALVSREMAGGGVVR